MALFKYNGRTARGDAVGGSLESESAEALANHLFARGITPTEIKPVAPSQDVAQDLWRRLGGGQPTAHGPDPVLAADVLDHEGRVAAAARHCRASRRRRRTRCCARRSAPSSSTCKAAASCRSRFGRFPDVFSKFYVSVIKVGESSGTLETAFLRMYEYLGMEKRIRDKVKAALRYPATVIVAIGDRHHRSSRCGCCRSSRRSSRRSATTCRGRRAC